jgi:hypothetical protein
MGIPLFLSFFHQPFPLFSAFGSEKTVSELVEKEEKEKKEKGF